MKQLTKSSIHKTALYLQTNFTCVENDTWHGISYLSLWNPSLLHRQTRLKAHRLCSTEWDTTYFNSRNRTLLNKLLSEMECKKWLPKNTRKVQLCYENKLISMQMYIFEGEWCIILIISYFTRFQRFWGVMYIESGRFTSCKWFAIWLKLISFLSYCEPFGLTLFFTAHRKHIFSKILAIEHNTANISI